MRLLALALAAAAVGATAIATAPPTRGQPRQAGAPTAFERVRTQRLLEERVACLGCHVIEGRGGRIGPPLDGIAERADAGYVRSVIADPAGVIDGTLMPRQRLPERELDRLTAFLMTLPSAADAPSPRIEPEAPPALSDPESEDGALLYARHCAACHGPTGVGDGWNAPALPVTPAPHADAERMGARTDDSLFDAIFAGAFVLDGSPRMPPYRELLSTAQIRALVAHIRTLCGCAQPAWAGSE